MSTTWYLLLTALILVVSVGQHVWAARRRRVGRNLSRFEGFDRDELAMLGISLTRHIQQRPPSFYEDAELDRLLYEEVQREVAYRHSVSQHLVTQMGEQVV